jgi:hypothetical protein
MSKVRSLLVIVSLLAAIAVHAQTTFVIERIDVNPGARVRPGIIRAETRLKPGRSYTAEELDQALYRIRRLPFVVDATYSLAQGSAPSSRVMIINIVDQAFFNYSADVNGQAFKATGGAETTGGFGFRFFPGMSGVLDLTAGGSGFSGTGLRSTGSPGDINLQYSAYGLFGTSAYINAGLATRTRSSGGRGLYPSFLAGLPIGRTQTIRARYANTTAGTDHSSEIGVDWLLERTDDPYFTRRGLRIVAGPERTTEHNVYDIVSGNPAFGHQVVLHVDRQNESNSASVRADAFRELAQHSAYWSRFSASRVDESIVSQGYKRSDRITAAHVLFGLAHNFDHGRDGSEAERRVRVEAGIGYLRSLRTAVPPHTERSNGPEMNAGFAFRSRWGVVHLDFTYSSTDTLIFILP